VHELITFIAQPFGEIMQLNQQIDRPESFNIKQTVNTKILNELMEAYNAGNYRRVYELGALAIEKYPNELEILNLVGMTSIQLGMLERAKQFFQRAIIIKPDDVRAYINIGNVLGDLGEFNMAIRYLKKAGSLAPKNKQVYYNLGVTFYDQGSLREAESAYKKVLLIDPYCSEANNNLANVHRDLGHFEEAVEAYETAINVNPDYADAYYNLGLLHWRKMNFKLAFDLMEWRWSGGDQFAESKFESENPGWKGEEGVDVFVWKEQGIGDEIMFGSMISELNEKSGDLIVECDRRLIPLYERSFPANIMFVDNRTQLSLDDYDSHIAIGSLAKHFRHDLKDFKNVASGWLKADPKRVNYLRRLLSNDEPDKIVGISWFTKSTTKGSEKRNVPLNILAEYLKKIPGKLVSLQYGDAADDLKKLNEDHGVEIITLEGLDLNNDIDGLAALISACNVVISIDNLTVHLAGALGVDTRVLLPALSNERWGTVVSDSYWYDYLTLYRQDKPGEWGAQFEDLIAALNCN
jgi:tetratricopeptide (TPR) repeat protein